MHCDREQEREAWEAAVQELAGLAKKAKAFQGRKVDRHLAASYLDRPSLDARKGSASIIRHQTLAFRRRFSAKIKMCEKRIAQLGMRF